MTNQLWMRGALVLLLLGVAVAAAVLRYEWRQRAF
jgi:hypothetical protein